MAEEPGEILKRLISSQRSLALATLGENGDPAISYAPFVQDEAGCFHVLVSGLAPHTAAMMRHPVVAAMIIADESASSQIFARPRATFRCRAEPVARSDPTFTTLVDALAARCGPVVGVLRELPDFVLFRLRPESGRLVIGFAQAFELTGPALKEINPIDPRADRPS